ncbi:terminase small subunit [Halomonas sp. ATCH28]|uniref:Terminase small subunit n=1 Tax=Halomonas gemina TaxID=2945105 RepID=A0ABT0T1V7_9GAMM|nr:terminase small subunit [Halomonas gemina]MCL7940694.1 terminase small subunit [Halomonas gemina]
MKKLTPRQEAFAYAYVETGSACEAYRRAYTAGNMSAPVIGVEAYRVLHRPHVSLKVEEIREHLAELEIWKRTDSLMTLAEIAREKETASKERINAVRTLNEMHGWNVQTVQRKGESDSEVDLFTAFADALESIHHGKPLDDEDDED